MDCIVHGVAKSWTQLSDFHFTNQGEWRSGLPMQETQEIQVQSLGQEDPPEKEMATHSRIVAWRMPRTEKFVGI